MLQVYRTFAAGEQLLLRALVVWSQPATVRLPSFATETCIWNQLASLGNMPQAAHALLVHSNTDGPVLGGPLAKSLSCYLGMNSQRRSTAKPRLWHQLFDGPLKALGRTGAEHCSIRFGRNTLKASISL